MTLCGSFGSVLALAGTALACGPIQDPVARDPIVQDPEFLWHDDLDAARDLAARADKPLLIVFR